MKNPALYFLLFLFPLASCGIFGGKSNPNTTQQKLVGKWVLQSMKQGDSSINKDKFGGEAYMEFQQDGQIITKLPGQQVVQSRYYIDGDKILDLGSKTNESMNIKSLEGNSLVLALNISGKVVELRLSK